MSAPTRPSRPSRPLGASARRRSLPVVLQATTTECGLASLAMVMARDGHCVPLHELRSRAGIGRDGASLLVLKRLAEEDGYTARAFRGGLGSVVDGLGLPLVAAWDDAHFVVIERTVRGGLRVIDPAIGRTTMTMQEASTHFRGVVLRLEATPAVERRHPRRQSALGFVASFVPSIGPKLVVIFALSILTAFIAMLPAALTSYLVDSLGVTIGSRPYTVMAVVVAGLSLLHFTSSALRSGVIMWFEKLADGEMTASLLGHLMRLPLLFFQARPAGDVLIRFSSISYVRDSLSGRILPMLVDLVFVIVYSTLILTWSHTHLLVLGVLAAVQAVAILLYGPRAKELADQEVNEMSRTQSVMVEALGGMETTKALGTEEQVLAGWGGAYQRQLNLSARRQRLDNHLAAFLSTVGFAGPAILLLVGVHEVLADRLSLGQMLAVNAIAAAALTPIQQIGMNLQVIQTVRVHLNRLHDLLDEEVEDTHPEGIPADLGRELVLEEVSYSYTKDGQEVLSEVGLTIRPGEFLAIVGPSGSGKSTLSRICLGLVEPTRGRVRLGDTPLSDVDLRSLRRQSGIVTQGSTGFAGSIRANVRVGRSWVTDEDVVRALETAALGEEVSRMPLGLDTPLGESGQGLSGGQLQRLAIARALAGSPGLIIFDEATSDLDGPAEATVYASLAALEATRVVIAHRLSTIAHADRILFLVDGRVAALGAHEELLVTCPDYAGFVRSQMVREPDHSFPAVTGH
ncbi:peptidase domain-containing ABC transporter [Actinomyces respiraculi]|uniref:peptidase domain-containing ABC transporter n=1 Tax=Actinomyces respiraculi TaxID=2744574 RepID=UPI001424895C|nr:peptidase domain-containing ABC transporter [Actinomyces respiraculi]